MKIMKYLLIISVMVGFLYGDYILDSETEQVYDTTSNIVWSDHNVTNPDTNGTTFTWIEAYNYCEALDLNGTIGWHLPSFNQLFLLADRSKYNPAINNSFVNVQHTQTDGIYWSSTSNMQKTSEALVINFYDGRAEKKDKTKTAYVRCFREWN